MTEPVALAHWIARHRRRLTDRGRWLLGGEPGTDDPAGFATARLRVLIVRLSEYHVTAGGITHQYLAQLAHTVPGVFVDHAWLPPAADEALLRADRQPLLFGTTSRRGAHAFDVIAISLSVIQELLNLPALLAHSGVPLNGSARAATGAPWVLLGGGNATATAILHGPNETAATSVPAAAGTAPIESNTLSVSAAAAGPCPGLVDAVFAGDGEDTWPAFLALLADHRDLSRPELLRRARTQIPGVYDPAAYVHEYGPDGRLTAIVRAPGCDDAPLPVVAHHAATADRGHTFHAGFIPYDDDNAGSSHLLITAGCPFICAFCKESWEQKPYRECIDIERLRADALALKANLGLDELNLMTFNANTYSVLLPLLDALDPLFDRVSLKSQRFDGIVRQPHLLARQLAAGKRTFTCAMEGISDRIRRLLGKQLGTETLLAGFAALFAADIRQMKVFLIVTGDEAAADLAELAELLARLRRLLAGRRSQPALTFSLAALFCPPNTPLQYAVGQWPPAPQHAAMRAITEVVERAGWEVRISAGPADAELSHGLSHSDRRATAALVAASLHDGLRYRGEVTEAMATTLARRLAQVLPAAALPGKTPLTADTCLPWDDIATGHDKHALWLAWSQLTPHRVAGDRVACDRVANDLGAGDTVAAAERNPAAAPAALRPTRSATPASAPPETWRLTGFIPPRLGAVGDRFFFAAFARLLMLGMPALTPRFVRFTGALPRDGAGGLFIGDFTLRPGPQRPVFDRSALAAMNAHGRGLRVDAIAPARGPLDQAAPKQLRCLCHLAAAPEATALAKRIDDILSRYRIKHLKRWQGEQLRWEIQSGHAKKCGLVLVSWQRGAATIEVVRRQQIERHLLGQIAPDADFELSPG